jgi:MoaA/NifB/PqqE/SkfB family radical SAM enzyme
MGRIVIELTQRCNLRCTHCPDGRHGGHGDLPLEVIETVLREAQAHGFEELAFTGGEPTLHRQFFEVIAQAAEAGYRFGFVTNGWNFPRIYSRLLPYRAQLAGITFSLDGATEATHDVLRGKGSYRRVLQAMSVCVVNALPFTLNMVLTRCNAAEVEALVELAARLGSRGVRFGPLMPTPHTGERGLALTLAERRALEQRIRDLQRNALVAVALAPGYYTPELFPCGPLQLQEFNIDWRGQVTLCCHLSGYGERAGDGDVVGHLSAIPFAEALARLQQLQTWFQAQKRARHASGQFQEADYFPCLYCVKHFDKLPGPLQARVLRAKKDPAHADSG